MVESIKLDADSKKVTIKMESGHSYNARCETKKVTADFVTNITELIDTYINPLKH